MSRRLGEILVDAKVLPPQSVSDALERQRGAGKRLGAVLVEMGLVDEQTVVAALSEQFNMPVADLRHQHADDDAVARVPEKMARSLNAAPIRLTPLGLEVAVADTLDAAAVACLAAAAGTQILLRLASVDDVRHAVDQCYPSSSRHRRHSVERTGRRGARPASMPRLPPDDLDSLLVEAVRAEASEVSIERHFDDTRVLMRVDRTLRPLYLAGATAMSLSSKLADGRHHSNIDGRVVQVTVATIVGPQSKRVRLRLSYRDGARQRLDQLGMPPQVLRSFTDHLAGPGGLIVVSGRRRSGRSTTLDAGAAMAAAAGHSVIAVGDSVPPPPPLVFRVLASEPGVWDAVEAQQADFVAIDELDDAESVRWALRMAASGTTVLAAVAAHDGDGAVARLLALGAGRGKLATALTAVVCQRLDSALVDFELLSVNETFRHAIRAGCAG